MKLTPLRFEDLSKLKYELFSCETGSLMILIARFDGNYGYGSVGSGDAAFMEAIMEGALAAWEPQALIIDLQSMAYEWGDDIEKPFGVANWYSKGPFPTAVVMSDLNRAGLMSLTGPESDDDPARLLFDSLEDALKAVEEQHKQLLDKSRKS